jgi:hypothetical protein
MTGEQALRYAALLLDLYHVCADRMRRLAEAARR